MNGSKYDTIKKIFVSEKYTSHGAAGIVHGKFVHQPFSLHGDWLWKPYHLYGIKSHLYNIETNIILFQGSV